MFSNTSPFLCTILASHHPHGSPSLSLVNTFNNDEHTQQINFVNADKASGKGNNTVCSSRRCQKRQMMHQYQHCIMDKWIGVQHSISTSPGSDTSPMHFQVALQNSSGTSTQFYYTTKLVQKAKSQPIRLLHCQYNIL